MIDCSNDECYSAYETLQAELKAFSSDLAAKPRLVLCNKIDTEGGKERAEQVAKSIRIANPSQVVIPMSVYTRHGLDSVRKEILSLVEKMEEAGHVSPSTKQPSGNSSKSDFLKTRSVCEDEPVQYPGSEV